MKDSSVGEFSAGNVLTVMDARCSLCARGATWIARNDKAQEFTIIPVQSSVGSALMRHYGLDPSDPSSWLYLEDGLAYSSLDALTRVGRRLGGVWRGLGILRILPTTLQDFMYRAVARNRYRIFGSTDLCTLPDAEVQKRLLS
ncbi:MAG: thiol-disulfide oxidoreductase DCC family protein [Boseongicola sp.]